MSAGVADDGSEHIEEVRDIGLEASVEHHTLWSLLFVHIQVGPGIRGAERIYQERRRSEGIQGV